MSSETVSPPPPISPSAKVIGNAFVEQYYHILHHSPELVYRFYQDSSVISRPGSDGVMTSVTTMQGINEKILSFDYKECKAEIKTADTQKSYKDGVTVLVTGCLTGKDNLKRKFAQSFFLAPQDIGFFVLNDVFRYVDDGELLENHPVKEIDNVTVTMDPEPVRVPDPLVPDRVNGNKKSDQLSVEVAAYDEPNSKAESANEESSITIEPVSHSHENFVLVEVETLDDGPKTYASIVKVAKGNTVGNAMTTKIYASTTNNVKVTPKKTETRSVPVPEALDPSNASTPESGNDNDEVEGFSIYIRNLPFAVTDDQLETEFKKFGPIKQGGIQVRNNRQHGYCFGFVEFESPSSMDNAIKASPITIGGRQAVIEIKRTTSRAGNGGRGSTGQGGPHGNGFFRGRGGRSFGRVNEYVDRRRGSEFPARGGGRGFSGRGGRISRPSYHAVADSA